MGVNSTKENSDVDGLCLYGADGKKIKQELINDSVCSQTNIVSSTKRDESNELGVKGKLSNLKCSNNKDALDNPEEENCRKGLSDRHRELLKNMSIQ